MKKALIAALAAGVAVATAVPADARQACGHGWHRNYNGRCVPNRGWHRGWDRRPVLVIGSYYRGHGYWDGHRYWRHRYRDRDMDPWRYRD